MTASTTALFNSARAELLRLRKWPAVWITIGAWLALTLSFGYLFDYISYATGQESFTSEGLSRAQVLAQLLPAGVPEVLVGGMPMFGGALAMVLGALVAGNGFGWGTWKTAFTQGPSRLATIGGSLLALTTFVGLIVAVTLGLCFLVSFAIALAEGAPMALPAIGDLSQSVGAGLMVLEMWALLGYAIGILARGPALAAGLGLVWALVVENLLRGVGDLLAPIEQLTRVLPGTAGGSLIGAVIGTVGDTPGVLDAISGSRALITVAIYVATLTTVVLIIVRRRDLA